MNTMLLSIITITKEIFMDNKKTTQTEPSIPHEINLVGRKKLHITGVFEVLSATPSSIQIKSAMGHLSIVGTDLKIKNLAENEKMVDIDGEVSEIKYQQGTKGILKKVFK